MVTNPLVSIIVPNYNGLRWLGPCLTTITAQTYQPIEIIVVDNASTDASCEFIRANFPGVRILRLPQNCGYAGANNHAARAARGDFLLFLNNDTKLAPNAVAELVTALLRDPKAAIAAPRITDYDGTAPGTCGMSLDIFGYPYAPAAGESLFYADGAAFLIRHDVFEALGGFDEDYFLFYEDMDLSWRTWLAGYTIIPVSTALVNHYGSGSAPGGRIKEGTFATTPQRRYLGERNRLTNLLKNFGFRTLIWILPCYIAMTAAAALLLAATGRWQLALAYPKAYWWNVTHLRRTMYKRSGVQQSRKVPDREIMSRMHKGSAEFALLQSRGLPRVL